MKDDMKKHEEVCVYRPIYCPDLSCSEKVTYVGLMDHFGEAHKYCEIKTVMNNSKFKIKTKIGTDVSARCFLPTLIKTFDQNFFVEVVIDDEFLFSWIYIHGDPDSAKNYGYEVKVSTLFAKMNISERVHSLTKHSNDVKKGCLAFSMPKVRLEEFLDEDSNLVLEYQIRNLKEEAKEDNVESGISDDDE